jgi:hypothetical protein
MISFILSRSSGLNSIPSLMDEGVLLVVVEVAVVVIADGSDLITAISVPNGSENVVASDLVQQSKETLFASQHQEVSSLGSQRRIASLPAAEPSNKTLVLLKIIEYRLNLLTVGANVWAFLILPVLVRTRVALIVVFFEEVAEAVGEALPVERTAGAAFGGTGAVVWGDVAIRIVASLGLNSVKAACEEGDEEGRQRQSDCEGG